MVTKVSPPVMNLPFLMPEQYGAIGDGATDDSTAIQDWLEACRDSNKTGMAYGKYRLDSSVTIVMDTDDHISIQGGGMHTETFIINNTTGGLYFDGLTTPVRQFSVQIKDVQFKPAVSPASGHSGYPLKIARSPTGLENDSTSVLENVYVGLLNDSDTSADFIDGISCTGGYRNVFRNVRVASRNATTKWTQVISVDDCYKPEFWGCYLNVSAGAGSTYGIKSVGTVEEGFVMVDSTVNGADTGLHFVRDGREPEMRINGCHFNSESINIYLEGLKYGVIQNSLLYTDNASGNATDILAVDVDGLDIDNTVFRTDGNNKRHVRLEPKSGGVVRNVRIKLNQMFADTNSTPPVLVKATCTNIELVLPVEVPTTDFASYPARIVEVETGAEAEVTISTNDALISYNEDALAGPSFELYRFRSSPASLDVGSSIEFYQNNDADEKTQLAVIRDTMNDATDGAENGQLDLFLKRAGTNEVYQRWLRPAATSETGTFLLVQDGASTFTLHRVTVGANDSAGAGFRELRVANS
jgi:hypothetical protein